SNRNYALKIVDLKNLTDEEISALKIEFRLLNKINHPNIVQAYEFDKVYECDREEFIGSYFFISEFIDGKNLLEFFKSPLNLNEIDEFLLVLNQICTTLYYIHQLGIIHFDIRPENILIEHNNSNQLNIKFIDFGFSTLKAKQIRGTPLYISPELISGKEVDFRTDLYSLG
ncbi:MAG: serine/threonine protein kinase, partial [bacterium]|nr:serine/threonine protein kinase [bacterium]